MRRRLTEANLDREISKHIESCTDCGSHCEVLQSIEASFYNEVDHRIDKAKERRGDERR